MSSMSGWERSASPSSSLVPGQVVDPEELVGLVPGPHGELQGPAPVRMRGLAPALNPTGKVMKFELRSRLAG